MTSVTQCPECGTRFKASSAQLEAHQGMVRCGYCHAAFNALQNLHEDERSPQQLDLPMELEEVIPEPAPAAAPIATLHDAADTEIPYTPLIPARKPHAWAWISACIVLLILLLWQALYFFRVEIAARLPGTKPLLLGYCELLHCTVPLPRNADFLTIEFSTLEANPTQANVITLIATLRNHASYALAYPNLELTLNDVNDRPLARRSFRPSEYLTAGENENSGLPSNRDFNVKINLDTTTLPAAGYRLLLSYPN